LGSFRPTTIEESGLESLETKANVSDISKTRNQSNIPSQTEFNQIPTSSHQIKTQPNVETVIKDDIVNKTETLKRKLPETDSFDDMRLNAKSKMSKSSSDTPKIRWRK